MANPAITRRMLLARARAGILGTAAVGLLAACGAGAAVSTGTAATSVATSTAASSAAPVTTAATSAAPTTVAAATTTSAAAAPASHANAVDFWQWGSGYVPGFDTLVKSYIKAQPKEQVVAANPSDYWNKVVTTLASGTGPDVFLMNNVNFKQYAKNGNVADLGSYANADKTATANLKATLAAAQDWYHYQGKLMGVPWDYSTGIIVYNLDQFQAVGLPPAAGLGKQWDWETLRTYATKLTQKTGPAITRSGLWIGNGLENGWYTFAVANGASFFNKDLSQCTIASEEAIAGLEFVLNMLKDGVSATTTFMDTANKAVTGQATVFTNGATAMQLVGDWNITTYEKTKSINWDATIFPYATTTGKTANTSNLRGLVLNPESKKKDSTWAWMAYLLTPEVQNQIPTLFGEVPANNTSATDYYFNPDKGGPPAGRKTLSPDLEATTPLPASDLVSWTNISSTAGKEVGTAFDLKVPAADALKKVQDTINGMIAASKGA